MRSGGEGPKSLVQGAAAGRTGDHESDAKDGGEGVRASGG